MKHSKGALDCSEDLSKRVEAARGLIECDLTIRNVHYLDVFSGKFIKGDVTVHQGIIVGIDESYAAREVVDGEGAYVVPGFIDAHVHIESSMMTPDRFEESVLPCGTTSAIWDPHEIANVKGTAGIQWALDSSEKLALDVFVMVPSCVPSTNAEMGFETSGAQLRSDDLLEFRDHPRVLGLAEMMNFPGLLNGDPDILAKLTSYSGLFRDGHCPQLSGKDLNAYGAAGIHSCHESTSLDEAREKLRKGIHVWIREGSCAKDAETLIPLIDQWSSATVGLCSDDRNPLDIRDQGHISFIVDLALRNGIAAEAIFRTASFATARAYGLMDRGALAPGFFADMVLVRPKKRQWSNGLEIVTVWKEGRDVQGYLAAKAESDQPGFVGFENQKNLNLNGPDPMDLLVERPNSREPHDNNEKLLVNVIGVRPGQIVTDHLKRNLAVDLGGHILADASRDILKIAVWERHHGTGYHSVGFIEGFGIKKGAIATSINHDSHNIIAVGADDAAILQAVDKLKEIDGGIVVTSGDRQFEELKLPIGGLMTSESPAEIAELLRILKAKARSLGCELEEPFLTLSFMALPVIPSLKITDRGLVDVKNFKLVSVVDINQTADKR
jgi:adenine deaminase